MRLAADVFERIQQDLGEDNELLQGMIASLDEDALHPAGKKGMPASFFADLERIDKKKLKKGDECPICRKDFLDGTWPGILYNAHIANACSQTRIRSSYAYHAIKTTSSTSNAYNHG